MRDLAEAAGTSLGSTARTVDLLDRAGLLERDDTRRIAEVDWPEMIRRWAEEYELFGKRARVARFVCPRGLPRAVEQIKDSKLRYALSGSLAAQNWAPLADPAAGLVYVSDLDLFRKQVSVAEARDSADLLVIEPADDLPFQRRVDIDGVGYVAPAQACADLLVGPGRNPSEGLALLGWMQKNEKIWRPSPKRSAGSGSS